MRLTIFMAGFAVLVMSVQPEAQVQPERPVPPSITLDFGVTPPWSNKPHNGVDYVSPLGNDIVSVGPSGVISPRGYTKPNASRFGSINPDRKGPAIWMKYTLSTGEPIYVLYGHTSTSWVDDSTGTDTDAFKFEVTYTVKWKLGDQIGDREIVGATAPFYNTRRLQPHLHVSVFKPKKVCSNGLAYCEPPRTGWGYSDIHLRTGDYIDPEQFFTDPQYRLLQPQPLPIAPTAGFTMAVDGARRTDGERLSVGATSGTSVDVTLDSRCIGLPVGCSFDPDGDIREWHWTVAGVVVSRNSHFTHSFLIGEHTVALVVKDNADLVSAPAQGTVEVTAPRLPSAWSTVGHDPQHTGSSQFIGPQFLNSPRIIHASNMGITANGPPVIDGRGVVYVVTTRAIGNSFVDSIDAFNPDGTVAAGWPFTGPSGAPLYASPSIGPDGTLYAGFGSDLYAIVQDGAQKWATPFHTPGGIFSASTIHTDGTIYVSAVANGAPLYAVNPDGSVKWQTSGVSGYSAVTLGLDGTIFASGGPVVGFSSGGATAFNPDGSVRWEAGFGGSPIRPSSLVSAVVSTDGTLYGVITGGDFSNPAVVGVDPSNGSIKYQATISGASVAGGGGLVLAIGPDGRVFCLTTDRRIVGFSSDLGTVLLDYSFAPYFASYPLAVGADGTIYAALANGPDQTGKLIALANDGTLKGEYVTPANTQLGPPAIGLDGTLFVGTTCCSNGDVGKIYAFPR